MNLRFLNIFRMIYSFTDSLFRQLSSSELQRLQEFDTLEAKVSQQESILALLKAPFPKSCEEIRLNDESKESGMYWIDPDGHATGDPAIYVYCNMSTGKFIYI
jgi:Fibrillar collagen C-terminal domain